MSFEHPNRNNESMRDVELDIMSRPPEHNTTNLDLDRMNLMLDILCLLYTSPSPRDCS